jgi:hypothetical protein
VKNTLVSAVMSDIVLYILQFLIIPLFYANVRQVNEGALIIIVTTVLVSAIGMFAFTDRIGFWLLGFVLYVVLMIIYTPQGAYRIGITGIDLDGLHSKYDASKRFISIAAVAVGVLILQLGTWGVVKLIKTLSQNFKR